MTIRTAHSCAQDPGDAVAELKTALAPLGRDLVVFFSSVSYDRNALEAELAAAFADCQVVGCTTAGEIGPAGCRDRSLTGVLFPAALCTAVTGRIGDLRAFSLEEGAAFAGELRRRLAEHPAAAMRNQFAFLLVDGLYGHEEQLAHALQQGLGEIPLVGGSAGDSMSFERTSVYADGRFASDAAVLVLGATSLPIAEFKTQHFVPTDERLVVTEADPARRLVRELNGLPAAREYARALGVPRAQLSPSHFAASPVVVLMDGAGYVRSIQKLEADDSIKFYCAIERGVVLRVARGVDLVANLESAFAQVRARVGPPQLVLAFDCILRRLEIAERGLEEAVGDILTGNNAVGFNTYGEQFCGVHVNQTLTALAFGRGSSGASAGVEA